MRGADTFTENLFTTCGLDDFVPENHLMRAVRKMVNQVLKNIEPLLSSMYGADIKGGRPSIAPEKLLRSWAPTNLRKPALILALWAMGSELTEQ